MMAGAWLAPGAGWAGYSLRLTIAVGRMIPPTGAPAPAGLYASGRARPAPCSRRCPHQRIMADNVTAVTNEEVAADWIELFNSKRGAVSLENWSLTDDGNRENISFHPARRFRRGFLIAWCDNYECMPGCIPAALARNRRR